MSNGYLGELYAELNLKTNKLNDGVKKSHKTLKKLEGDIADIQQRIEQKLGMIGAALSVSVTAPLTIMGVQAVNTFSQFEQSMQNTFSVMGASKQEMNALKEKAEQMGATTRFSASQAADALYSLGSAGQNAGQAINSLDGVLSLAGATGSDLAFTSQTLASTLSQFNLTADKSAHVADVFAKAISKSQANMGKLSYSMKYVGPVAKGLGVSLETTTASLMQLYNAGFGGEQAGTILRAGLQKLASGSDDLKNKLQEVGLTYDEVNPKTNDLADIMDKLRQANVDVTKANELFGEAAAAGMAKLIESGGAAIRTMDSLLVASDGAALEMQKIQNASFANTKAELASAFEAVQITLTSNVIPAIDTVAKMFTGVLQVVNNLPVGIQTAGTTLGAFAALAGPLLLVAVGVKKIKREMAQLNLVMAGNPIFTAGVVIAAVSAAALGAIAQMKKAHEDWVHGAAKGVEEVKKLQADALKEGNKGRYIKSLLDEYTELKNKTQKTADEQKRYNDLMAELQSIIPNAVSEYDKAGNAIVLNEKKITEAYERRLERERVMLRQSIAIAKAKIAQSKSVLASYEGEDGKAAEKVERATARMNEAVDKTIAIREKYAQYKKAKAEGDYEAANGIAEQMKNMLNDAPDGVGVYKVATPEKILSAFEAYQKAQAKQLGKLRGEYEEVFTVMKEQQEAQIQLNSLIKQQGILEDAVKNKKEPEKKKTRQEHADAAWDAYEKQKKKIQKDKKWAEAEGKEYDALTERLKVVQAQIEKLRELEASEIADGVFLPTSKELQKLKQEAALLSAEMEAKGKKAGAARKDKDTEEKNLQQQLGETDSFYKKQLSSADEYGRNKKEIEEKWYKARNKVLADHVAQREKITKKTRAEILNEDTGGQDKKSGVTVREEQIKTHYIFTSNYEKFLKGINEKRKTIAELEAEIKEVQETIEADIDVGNIEGAERGYEYVKTLEEEAQTLKKELGLVTLSLSEIDTGLAEIANIGKSNYQLKLIDIDAEKKRLEKVVDEAVEAGKITTQQAEKEKKKIEKQEKEEKEKAAAETADPYIKLASSLADTLTDIICEGIEKGAVSAETIFRSSGSVLTQIAGVVPNAIAKGVLGGLGLATTLTGRIISSIRKKREEDNAATLKAAEEYNRKSLEIMKKHQKEAENITRESGKRITHALNKQATSTNDIFKSQLLKMEKQKTDDFLNKVNALKTEGTYNYTVAETYRKKAKWYHWNTTVYTRYVQRKAHYTVGEVLKKYQEAMSKGDTAAAMQWKNFAERAIKKGLSDAGFAQNTLDPITNYLSNLDGALAQYVKQRDLTAFKKALKNQLYEALVNKAVNSAMSERIGTIFKEVEAGSISFEEGMNQIETIGNEAAKIFDKYNKHFGVSKEAADSAKQAWTDLSKSITSALSSSLANAAYDADWGSFKKAFAGEMKKAIIQSTIASAGLKQQVDAIIKSIMEDGQITGEEINSSIDNMRGVFDSMEDKFSDLAKITKALEGGVEVQSKNSGTIIQQLSGSDRDWFLEVFKDGFSKINKSIELNELTVQQIQATQIIIQSMTFNSYGGVHITANEDVNLKEMLTEVVKEAMAD